MRSQGKLHALLATARVANLPSVVSNVFCGMALALVFGDVGSLDLREGVLITLAGMFLYLSGNFLNDWYDRDWDASHRPERALPRGLWHSGVYLGMGVSFALIGVVMAMMVGFFPGCVALFIIAMVLIYTRMHKRSAWAVLPMGLCRASLPVAGALAVVPSWNGVLIGLFPAVALLVYIAGLSLEARRESLADTGGTSTGFRPLLLMAGAAPLSLIVMIAVMALPAWMALIGSLPLGAWLWICRSRFRRPISRLVSAFLAGIPLVDWVFLLPVGWVVVPGGVGLMALVLPPAAMLMALMLQRVAPAT